MLFITPATAQTDGGAANVTQQPAGTIIVPDQFLRRWDPVTVFFDHDMGKRAGTPEDAPGRLVSMAPVQPGAWTWLDGRTLQFRPAVPWPPLSEFTFRVQDGAPLQLSRLLDPTVSTTPANGSTGLEGFNSLTLDFSEPLDVKALPGMLDIAYSPLPGLDAAQAQHLTPADFDIKTVERSAPSDDGVYIVELHHPIPDGMAVTVSIGLSPVPGLTGTVEQLSFSTATPFEVTNLGCQYQVVPLTASGTIYESSAALSCNSYPGGFYNGNGEGQQASGPDQMAPNPGPFAALPVTTAKTPAVGQPDQPAPIPVGSNSAPRTVAVQFSTDPAGIDPITARNFIRISPPVNNAQSVLNGNELDISADFKTGVLYRVALQPVPMLDVTGRSLTMTGPSAVWLYWPPQPNYLTLSAGNGVVERYGPQMIPLSGRGYAQADVRIFAIDPRDRSFWPFPAAAITTSDNDMPPGPGEQAPPYTNPGPIDTPGLQAQIASLGSPSVSRLTPLPLGDLGGSAQFGLDLSESLARISGRHNPGTYLVGIRALDQAGTRNWMRLQVSDLSVTAVEETRAVRFVVTSLQSALPVPGASVEVDGLVASNWTVLARGTTDADGGYTWRPQPGNQASAPTRIVVAKDDDTLVLNPNQPPDSYNANGWTSGQNNWLGWTSNLDVSSRVPAAQTLCHMFTERPIYRPEDPVRFKAFIRTLDNGLLLAGGQGADVALLVTGPDPNANWRYKLTPDKDGNVYYFFNEKTTATGTYQAELDVNNTACSVITFIKNAYRLPKFRVTMTGPAEIPLDKPASIGMTAIYYAGGPAANRPVRWRVTEFPYQFAPAARPGFIYATSNQYQPDFGNQSNAAVDSEGTTDAEGRAAVVVDPTQEASNAARQYVVEATVTGDDDKTVTNVQSVLALPSFVLALQAPRYLDHGTAIPVNVLMVDANGKPLAGRAITLTLLRREWSSILQASDFSNGQAKYQTEVVDEKLIERTVTSGADVVPLRLPITQAGVYIVRLQAADSLGRLQTVSEDLFATGNSPVTWSQPPATVFKVTTDKPAYAPGDVAHLILQSPFQTGRALAIVELPDGGNQYGWVPVSNGYGVFSLPIEKSFMPRIPVHFALMRGRLPGLAADASGLDLRRPETIAATAWVSVTPVKNIVTTAITAPSEALPGSTFSLTVTLQDDQGRPVSGQVTLWLIDQAVLALAKEAPLNPLPHFIKDRGSSTAFSDTRNWPFGYLPLDENPGGDEGVDAAMANLLNKVTIRKNFNPMPYYNPALVVGPSGTVTVKIQLPDDLTVFRIHAVAVSGTERFGLASGEIAVRLPVIVEPNLPRFVRPGDRFSLAGIGRIVSGPGGAGIAQVATAGLTMAGPTSEKFNWQPNVPQNFAFPVSVPSPGYTPQGALARTSVDVTMAVQRLGDKASDGFDVALPIEPDRDLVHERVLADLTSAAPLTLPAVTEPARPGTIDRTLVLSDEPALVRLYAGLDYLQNYEFGCTEQRISLARAELAAKDFSAALDAGDAGRVTGDVTSTLAWVTNATTPSGLVSFWPGDKGVVTLTAWALEFLVEAQNAGFTVDPVEKASLIHALQQSLRSDYPNFVSDGAYEERAWALAALAYAGNLDRDYADELARQQNQLSLEGLAQVSLALQAGGAADAPLLPPLDKAIWSGVVTKLRNGVPVYGGLQEGPYASTDYPDIFPSETRTLAEMLRATASGTDPRRKLLVDALVTLGGGDGWGSTNENAEALLALTAYLKSDTGAAPQSVTVGTQTVTLSGTEKLDRIVRTDGGALTVSAAAATAANPVSVQDDLTYLPAADGAQVAPTANGFVVTAESDKVDLAGGPLTRVLLTKPGTTLTYQVGDVVENHLQLVNPEDRHYVAITVPLAAGMEPLDPTLATAPPEATPSAPPTLAPSYTAFLDDRVTYFYDSLPAGTYDFYFRTEAAVPGRFIQPAAQAVMMYDDGVSGGGAGAVVVISSK